MKLYRGIKEDFIFLDEKAQEQNKQIWKKILELRSKGDFSYPQETNSEILTLRKQERLALQNFTDNKKIAERYARQEKGFIVEIDVPKKEILSLFRIEFQNFSKRKEKFELVYVVSGENLHKFAKKWKLKIRKR